jgi:hypothetical protein
MILFYKKYKVKVGQNFIEKKLEQPKKLLKNLPFCFIRHFDIFEEKLFYNNCILPKSFFFKNFRFGYFKMKKIFSPPSWIQLPFFQLNLQNIKILSFTFQTNELTY